MISAKIKSNSKSNNSKKSKSTLTDLWKSLLVIFRTYPHTFTYHVLLI